MIDHGYIRLPFFMETQHVGNVDAGNAVAVGYDDVVLFSAVQKTRNTFERFEARGVRHVGFVGIRRK